MKFAILGVAMVLLFIVFHFLFIMFDFAYNNPDNGAFTLMDDKIAPHMLQAPSGYTNKPAELAQFFGLGRFIVLAMIIICFIAEVLSRRRSSE